MGRGAGEARARWMWLWLWLYAVTCIGANMLEEYAKAHPAHEGIEDGEYEFDPLLYMEVYSDVAARTMQAQAWDHYIGFGKKEGRYYARRFPDGASVPGAGERIDAFAQSLDARHVQLSDRTLVLYNIAPTPFEMAVDAMINSVKIMSAAIVQDAPSNSSNFYVFNIFGGKEHCVFFRYLPMNQANVAFLSWHGNPSPVLLRLRALDFLHGAGKLAHFGSVFFTDIYQRGPLAHVKGGLWAEHFRSLLNRNNVGVVGATMSCEVVPHVQGAGWAIRASLAPSLLAALGENYRKWVTVSSHHMEYISTVLSEHFNLSSLYHSNVLGQDYFAKICFKPAGEDSTDPTTFCSLNLPDTLFVPWNWKTHDSTCATVRRAMQGYLMTLPASNLHLPESVVGSVLHDLSAQYNQELMRDVSASQREAGYPGNVNKDGTPKARNQVCLLVRCSLSSERNRNASLVDQDYFSGFANFVESLRRQTDGHWIAYFFPTDDRPFSQRLKQILDAYSDARLQFLHIPKHQRPKYSQVDAGYTPTDAALRKLLPHRHCSKISMTNADNIYGSDLIRRVRAVRTDQMNGPRMVLAPIDSRNFLYDDMRLRTPSAVPPVAHDLICPAYEAAILTDTLGMTVQPRPIIGRVDLAGVFYDRAQFHAENVFFGNFTDPKHFTCIGCQDGYLTEYLVQNRHWRYTQLPVDGLQSLVFHGPSPAWCAAAGLVWLGHPDVNKARCLTQHTLGMLRSWDARAPMQKVGTHHHHQDVRWPSFHSKSAQKPADAHQPVFDWAYLDAHRHLCLPFTASGYQSALKNNGTVRTP